MHERVRHLAIVALGVFGLLAAIASGFRPAPAAVFSQFAPDGIRLRGFLYIGALDGFRVYTKGGHHQPLLARVHTGDRPPTALYVTRDGDIYVGNGYDRNILVYHRNALGPYRTLTGSGGAIGDVTVDIFGNVYATETMSNAGTVIDVFGGGSNVPTSALTDIPKAARLATDSRGDLFVQTQSDGNGSKVFEYHVGHAKPEMLPLPGYAAGGLSLNGRDQLVVCDGGGDDGFSGNYYVYDPPYRQKAIRFESFDGGIIGCIADRSDGGIWVSTRGLAPKAYLIGPLGAKPENVLLLDRYAGPIAVDWL